MLSGKTSTLLICMTAVCLSLVGGCGPEAAPEPAPAARPAPAVEPAKPTTPAKPVKPAEAEVAAAPSEGKVRMMLRPTAGTATYRVAKRSVRSINWEGVPEKDAFKENRNESDIEVVYDQNVAGVDENVRATSLVTFKAMKCRRILRNQLVVDFDSSDPADANSPLMKLIGRSYGIESTADNYVPNVFGMADARGAVTGNSPDSQVGLNQIMSPEEIRERHGTPMLAPDGSNLLAVGDTWKVLKTFSFDQMGLKSFEKIYKLADVRTMDGHEIAFVEMSSIPTTEVEKRFLSQQKATDMGTMFDATATYTGKAELDMTAGRVIRCSETMVASWLAVLPGEKQDPTDPNNREPVILKMNETRSFELEKID